MNYKLLLIISTFSITPIAFSTEVGAPQQPSIYQKDKHIQDFATAKKQMDEATIKKLEVRSESRRVQKVGADILIATKSIDDILFNAPLSIKQQHVATVVAILNKIATGIGVGIRAYGRRKEALQSIINTNEQILEAASQSFEKLEALSKQLEDLIDPKTIKMATQENKNPTETRSEKLLNFFSPGKYMNTFNEFTDSKYITDNKAKRWEKIKATRKLLEEEQSRFDDYIALLQIKFLERMMMTFHLAENKDENIAAEGKSKSPGGYIKRLEESIESLTKAIQITDQNIADLKNQAVPKDGILNRLKKTVGKDSETKKAQDLKDLYEKKSKYVQQKETALNDIEYYKELKVDPQAIKNGREDLLKKISEIKGRRTAKVSLEDLSEDIVELKAEIQNLQGNKPPTQDFSKDIGELKAEIQNLQGNKPPTQDFSKDIGELKAEIQNLQKVVDELKLPHSVASESLKVPLRSNAGQPPKSPTPKLYTRTPYRSLS